MRYSSFVSWNSCRMHEERSVGLRLYVLPTAARQGVRGTNQLRVTLLCMTMTSSVHNGIRLRKALPGTGAVALAESGEQTKKKACWQEVTSMKLGNLALAAVVMTCLAYGMAHSSPVMHDAVSVALSTTAQLEDWSSGVSWPHALTWAAPRTHEPYRQIAYELGPLLQRYGRGNINFYGYKPFGYFGYHSDAYKGYRAPGYYGYEYYYQYPAYNPGFRFRY